MAATRTTVTAVQDTIATALGTQQIQSYILDANLWVSEELADAGLTDKRLELIERYLACAFIRLQELGVKSATVKDVQESYQVDPQVTDYLKRAASFDPTGAVQLAFLDESGPRWSIIARVGTGFKDASTA